MKIKEVCAKTGLTEKAVRYYVENGLCSPQEYESRERKYLNFTDQNICELKDIAVMRRLGFSIEDIRFMKTDGGSIDGVMKRYIMSLSEELEIKKRIFSSLASEDYSGMSNLGELIPKLLEALKPDPAAPDFSKFEKEPFDDGHDLDFSEASGRKRLASLGEIFINCSTVIGTLMAVITLPGAVMLAVAALVLRRVRADYITMYEVLSGIGFIANGIAFIRSVSAIGGLARLSEIFAGSSPDFAVVQCRFSLLAAAAGLISLLILLFGKEIREQF